MSEGEKVIVPFRLCIGRLARNAILLGEQATLMQTIGWALMTDLEFGFSQIAGWHGWIIASCLCSSLQAVWRRWLVI